LSEPERERDEKRKLFITMQMQKRVVKMAARKSWGREMMGFSKNVHLKCFIRTLL
jgi:hypothetical protein